MLSPMYIFSAHNNRLTLSALHDGLEALHCSSDGPSMAPLGGPLLGKSEGHGGSGFIGNDKLRLCKAVPNLYVELRQSVLGVRVPEGIQMKGIQSQNRAQFGHGGARCGSERRRIPGLYGTPAPLRGWIRRWWVVLVTCEEGSMHHK